MRKEDVGRDVQIYNELMCSLTTSEGRTIGLIHSIDV